MDNRQKAIEMFPDAENFIPLCNGVRDKIVEMADYKDAYYSPLVDVLADIIEADCDMIVGGRKSVYDEIMVHDENWCEAHCTSEGCICKYCVYKWLGIKNSENEHKG